MRRALIELLRKITSPNLSLERDELKYEVLID
jgi:hypothetical protein